MKKTEYIWKHSHADNSFTYLIKSLEKIILKEIKLKKNYLDVGCGNGFLTKKIASNFKSIDAIDPSKSAIKHAKKNYKGKINFLNLDIQKYKLRNL